MFVSLCDHLYTQFPFWEGSSCNGLIEVTTVKIGILSVDFLGFVPDHAMSSQQRLPMEFHEVRFTRFIDQSEGVYPKSFHHPITAGNGSVTHQPHHVVHRLGRQGYK